MGEDAERILEGKARKAEGREKQTKSLRCAMGHEAKRDREIKKREYDRGKTECKRAPTKTASPGGDEGLGNKSGGAAPRRDRQPRSGNGKRIAGTEKANA